MKVTITKAKRNVLRGPEENILLGTWAIEYHAYINGLTVCGEYTTTLPNKEIEDLIISKLSGDEQRLKESNKASE